MTETKYLKKVLSSRYAKIQMNNTCDFCDRLLRKGNRYYNYGVLDRRNRQWTRLYFCREHADILDSNPEDLPEYAQHSISGRMTLLTRGGSEHERD